MGTWGHSQVEAEVLLLLEEVVEDELAQEVGVQGVVNDLGPAKLGDTGTWGHRGGVGTPGAHGCGDVGTQRWGQRDGVWAHGDVGRGVRGHEYGDTGTEGHGDVAEAAQGVGVGGGGVGAGMRAGDIGDTSGTHWGHRGMAGAGAPLSLAPPSPCLLIRAPSPQLAAAVNYRAGGQGGREAAGGGGRAPQGRPQVSPPWGWPAVDWPAGHTPTADWLTSWHPNMLPSVLIGWLAAPQHADWVAAAPPAVLGSLVIGQWASTPAC